MAESGRVEKTACRRGLYKDNGFWLEMGEEAKKQAIKVSDKDKR